MASSNVSREKFGAGSVCMDHSSINSLSFLERESSEHLEPREQRLELRKYCSGWWWLMRTRCYEIFKLFTATHCSDHRMIPVERFYRVEEGTSIRGCNVCWTKERSMIFTLDEIPTVLDRVGLPWSDFDVLRAMIMDGWIRQIPPGGPPSCTS